MTGTVVLPLPENEPNGVTSTKTTRGSPCCMSGHLLRRSGGQVSGDGVPRMRVLSPSATWFVALPVCVATQSHAFGGFGIAHSADGEVGQALPVFGV